MHGPAAQVQLYVDEDAVFSNQKRGTSTGRSRTKRRYNRIRKQRFIGYIRKDRQ